MQKRSASDWRPPTDPRENLPPADGIVGTACAMAVALLALLLYFGVEAPHHLAGPQPAAAQFVAEFVNKHLARQPSEH